MDIEPRVTVLEKDVAVLKTDVSYIHANFATKEDLLNVKVELKDDIHTSMNTLTWRIVGFNLGFNTFAITAVYFISNLSR